jgi:hypothetical protein
VDEHAVEVIDQTCQYASSRISQFDKRAIEVADRFRERHLWNDDDVETKYGAEYCDDNVIGGEHVCIVKADGTVELACFHKHCPDNGKIDKAEPNVTVLSYQWGAVKGTAFEWPGGTVSCRDCRFQGGNPQAGGFNASILPEGEYHHSGCT